MAGTRAQSGDRYGSGTLHSRQFLILGVYMTDVGNSFIVACDEGLWRETLFVGVALNAKMYLFQPCSRIWLKQTVESR